MAPAIVEPYNAILATHTSLETVDVCFLVDNQVSGHDGGARRLLPSGQPGQWKSQGS